MAEKENNDQHKVRIKISILRKVYEWITKIRGYASRIAEQAYLALKTDVMFGYGAYSLIVKFKNQNFN